MSISLWEEDEDKLLTDLVTSGVSWNEIASTIKRSKRGCQKRWKKIDPNFKSGYWDKEEDLSLILWVFSNLESRISSQHDLCENRRRGDVVKRTEFLKNQLLEKMFPEGIEKYKIEESKIRDIKKSSEKQVKSGAKRKIKAEHKESEDSEEDEDRKADIKKSRRKKTKIKEDDDFKEQKPNNEINTLKQQSLSREQFFVIAGIEDNENEWSKPEDEKLFELSKVLKKDWKSISKFIQGRSPESIHEHYINTLRWSAYEYKVDCDTETNTLSKLFLNQNELYVQDCMLIDEDALELFTPIALHLLDISITVKNEDMNKEKEDIDEKEKARKLCRRKIDEGAISSLKSKHDKFANPFMQKVECAGVKNSTKDKQKFKFNTNQDESEESNYSESSGLDLLLNSR